MGTGWRRAFCTTIPRNHNRPAPESESPCSSPKTTTRSKIGFQSSSNPSTPRLRCKTSSTPTSKNSNPSSPRSPFSLFRTGALRSSFKSNCGICSQSVKTGQGMAIFTAECSHEFHFPCISSHVKASGTSLICPVCQANWKEVPLLQLIREKQDQPSNNNNKDDSSPKIKQLDQIRSYDDDEPLLSPRAGFNPIPEELDDDDDEEEIHEFQGFFVDPNLSSSSSGLITNKKSRTIDVRVESDSSTASTALISVGRRHQTYALVVKVKAPAQTRRSSRAPIDLVTVLDVSCNMTTAKLQMLKRAMRLVISSLSTSDRLSIVAFSGSPKRLLPLQRMTSNGQKMARRIIDCLVCVQGSSCVGDALKKATKVLEDRRERNPVASIMLLSDGNESSATNASADSNHNERRRAPTSSTRFAHLEIPAADPSQQDDAFAKCVGGLLSVVVQDLRLQLSLGFSHSQSPSSILPEISAVYSWNGGRPKLLGSGGQVKMGDLYAEEERELLVEFRVPDDAISFIGAHQKMMMSVHFLYKDPANPNQHITKDQTILIPNFQKSVPESNTQRLKNLFVATRAIAESRRLVEMNDLSNAFHLLSSARAMLMQWSSADDEYVHALEVELGDLHLRRQYYIQLQQQQRRRSSLARSSSSNGRESPMTGAAFVDEDGEPLTPTSAWRAAERLAKLAIMRKSLNRSKSELHGFENARF